MLFVNKSKSLEVTMKSPQPERRVLKVDLSGKRVKTSAPPNY